MNQFGDYIDLLTIIGCLGIVISIFTIPVLLYKCVFLIFQKKVISKTVFIFTLTPLILCISSFEISDNIRDSIREEGIQNGQKIIIAIDKYYSKNKSYPDSLPQLIPFEIKYIPKPYSNSEYPFYYKKVDDYFELNFSQNVFGGFNYEVITFNQKDKHVALGELNHLIKTSHPHWKYYIFD
ncbi:MAG: hypothetical protein RLZZ175_2945 [Bacteroidota bacterium]|jgi:hypothetical protein